ncbi:Poly(ADP-ribose) polymerase catalytic domain containing protein [Amanita muscaria]
MPPRKKTTDSSATRSSARIKAAATPQPAVQVTTQPTTTTVSKSSTKRPLNDEEEEEEEGQSSSKPKSKKAKNNGTQQDSASVKKPEKPEKMVTVVKRGAAPIDPLSGRVDTHQVFADNETVWDAMLNQTDVSMNQNKNKFYVLQLQHPLGNDSQCLLYTRWGRVGENGQNQTKGPFPTQTAINEFKKQFKVKTSVDWAQRVGTTARKGKYTWLERDFEDTNEEEDKLTKPESKREVVPDSTLLPELQELCRLIFSTSLIEETLSSMNYDARKLPLGKLAKATILNGFAALKNLAEVIERPDCDLARQLGGLRAACEHLSSAYYSIIPHDFGRSRPIVIDGMVVLKKELELVDALGDMEVASKLITSSILTDEHGNAINPMDAHFRSLGLDYMSPVQRNSAEFSTLEAYVRDTHGATHRHYSVSVLNAYRVQRNIEKEAWEQNGYHDLMGGERLLLWHGSRSTNFAGILKQGLRIAPPEAPVTGYMFGKGVYFADMMSKSANYCYAHMSNNTGLLLLCEVAAQPFYERTVAEYDADRNCKANNKRATKGLGRTQPVIWKDAGIALNNASLVGCMMPDGPGQDVPTTGGYLQYNEYIVYDPSQIQVKYLLMVRM